MVTAKRCLAAFLLVLSACCYYYTTILASRGSDYTVLLDASTTTANQYPLWEEPTPTRDVVSSYGDYKWTYPKIHNVTRYAETRFMQSEMSKCERKASTQRMCCTIGGTSTGGGEVSNGCQEMNFMAEFQPIPPRPLFSLVDFLLAWHSANPLRTRFKMVFVGDSVTGQVFNAALCELARNKQVNAMTYDYFDYDKQIKVTTWRYEIAIRESHITLDNAPAVDFCIMFIRQFKLTANSKALNLYFDKADVVMVGLGLHYAPDEGFRSRIESALLVLAKQPPIVMWFGAPKQHFRYVMNDTQVNGVYIPGNLPVRFCGPIARVPPTHAWYQPLNAFAYDVVSKNLSIPASWIKWNAQGFHSPARSTKQQLHVHFFPFAELTSPFYRNHVSYNADSTKQSNDCTHPCGAPNLYEPFWDALYLIGPRGNNVRFPTGTQHTPVQVTKYAQQESLYGTQIMQQLTGELL